MENYVHRLLIWKTLTAFTVILFSFESTFAATELSGNVALEYRLFQNPPSRPGQHQNNTSVSAQPEYFRDWDDGKQSLTMALFLRQDQHDKERSHSDIRELSWVKAAEVWELRVGIRHEFWGVTESQHLVDIINQTDNVENFDGEDKLGQPMINLALIQDWGTVDLYLLPYFRERTFNSQQARLSFPIKIDQDAAQYESSDKNRHLDLAIRWSHSIDEWDIGLSHFSGTSRIPLLKAVNSSTLVPVYNQIDQTGLDLQGTFEDWLLKLEVISKSESNRRYTAMTGGFENTAVGVFDSQMDLGFLAEYLFDDRHNERLTPFNNDILVGARLVWNDAQSTELLAGVIMDLDHHDRIYNIEASRRIGDNWKINIEAKIFSNIAAQSIIKAFGREDHLQAELAWYF